MEFTVDYNARVHDNASRKSFARRVSFAEHAQVRLFQIPNDGHTNSTGSPQSSPMLSTSPGADQPPGLSNENDYPASFSRSRRRSSVRYSMAGSDDMDLTSANPGAFLQGEGDSALMDQEMEFDDDDMEVTDVLHDDKVRRRSLGGRQPFAPVRPRDTIVFPSDDAIPSDDDDNARDSSLIEGDSQEQSEVEQSREEMEFTVPMGQSLRPPPTEDPMWLALRQVTHSGDTPHEPELSSEDDIQLPDGQQGMDLNDAMARLLRVRDSLGTSTEGMTEEMDITTANGDFAAQEDSFLSTDDSINDDDIDQGNETLNVSRVVGRMSLGGDARMSLGYQDSTMDESGIYGSAIPPSSAPRPSIIPPPLPEEDPQIPEDHQIPDQIEVPRPTVFQLPSEQASVLPPQSISTIAPVAAEPPTKSPVFTFVPPPVAPIAAPRPTNTPSKPSSPVKSKPKPQFSAAFAPPVAKPSPKKPTGSSTPAHDTLNKRRFSVMQDGAPDVGRPSPAKRPALGPKPVEGTTGTPRNGRASSQSQTVASTSSNDAPAPAKRQSGYFARRKSLGTTFVAPQGIRREESSTPKPTSPAKRVNGGRTSFGAAPSDSSIPFERNATATEVPIIVLPIEETLSQNVAEAVLQPASNPNFAQAPLFPLSLTQSPAGRTPSPQPDTEKVDPPEPSPEEVIETDHSETQTVEDIVSLWFYHGYTSYSKGLS